ncbi:MAG: DUF4878 domain-containing protein [Chitinophagaceae bacterium]|nr:MAG: DUF4878 domain-containing protein [Chitinophagaceae bacterium]
MKKIILAVLVSTFLFGCQEKKNDQPQTATETGTAFIRASLDGDFERIESLLLNDTTNHQLFESYRDTYSKWPADKKKNYKAASYDINKLEELNDSVTIINYSNSYMNKPMEIKLVRENKSWLVDFKYTFSGNQPLN